MGDSSFFGRTVIIIPFILVSFFLAFATFAAANVVGEFGGCVVTNDDDAGPGSLRQCVLDAEEGSVITFSGDHAMTLDSRIIIGRDLTIDAGGFAVTLQADTTPGAAGHGLLTVGPDATVAVRGVTLRHGRGPWPRPRSGRTGR